MAEKFQGAAVIPPVGGNETAGRAELTKQLIELAFDHHQAGRIKDAESLYQQALSISPGQIDALYYLGVLYLQNGVYDAAEEFLSKALKKQSKFADGYFNLGLALQEQDKLKEAAKAYGQAIKSDKRFEPAQLNLGNVYMDLEQFERATSVFKKLIRLSPKSAQAHLNLGRSWSLRGEKDAAMTSYRQAVELDPSYADAHLNIGAILLEQDDFEDAKTYFAQALSLDPQNAEAYNNMGAAWRRDGYLDHAVSCFAMASHIKPDYADAHKNLGATYNAFGDKDRAEAEVRKGLELAPDSYSAHCVLGRVLRSKGEQLEAIDEFNIAIRLAPEDAEPYREMGLTLAENHQLELALKAFDMAIERNPKDAIALNNAGMTHILLGQLDEGVDYYHQAIEALPTFSLAHSNALFSLNYVGDMSQTDLARQHFAFGEMWDQEYDDAGFANQPDPERRLKIGYVSPDFRKHVVTSFVEEVLRSHDRTQFEIFCYAEVFNPDDVTERLKGLVDHWYSTVERNSVEVAQKIKDDGIDILIDLAGHTGNNRLPVFGLKPAPVQVTWVGYLNTTGMKNIDYIFTTSYFTPPGSEACYSEEIYCLPRVPVVFKAPSNPPDVSALPYDKNGYITFGCFNSLIKIGEPVMDAWAEILQTVPDSKLFLKAHAFGSESTVSATLAKFEARGIDPQRITCEGPSKHAEYLTRYGAIDLALDPFPYNGGTTTMETLCMGIPLLALEGQSMLSRIGAAMLASMNENSLIASSVEDYVAKAVAFAQSPRELAAMRNRISEKFIATGITDPVHATKDVEEAYRDIWRRWCQQRQNA